MSNLRPAGHHTITPSAVVPGAAKVISFLEKAFGGVVVDRYDGPNGSVMHSEVMVGDSVVMIGDPTPGFEAMPTAFTLYVADARAVDDTYRRALELGAAKVEEPHDQPWGYRSGTVRDTGGNRWSICAVVEVVSREEILHRMSAK